MDADRRRAVAHRRSMLRQRLREHGDLGPALDALDTAGAPYEVLTPESEGNWLPDWAYGDGRQHWAPPVAVSERHFADWQDAALVAHVRDVVSDLAGSGRVLVVFEGRTSSLRLAAADFVRHAAAILAVAPWPRWITAPPAQWLVEVEWERVRVGRAAP